MINPAAAVKATVEAEQEDHQIVSLWIDGDETCETRCFVVLVLPCLPGELAIQKTNWLPHYYSNNPFFSRKKKLNHFSVVILVNKVFRFCLILVVREYQPHPFNDSMRFLFLLLLLLLSLAAAWSPLEGTRETVYRCIMQKLDFDRDACVTRAEWQRMYDLTLSKTQKSVMPSVDVIFRLCQPKKQQDNCISGTDLDATLLSNNPTCLPTFTHIKAFKSWVCDEYDQLKLRGDV